MESLQNESLTLQTYNVHLFPPIVQLPASLKGKVAVKDDRTRLSNIKLALRQTQADFVSLSEVWYDKYASKLVQRLKKLYPYSYRPSFSPSLHAKKFLGSGLLLLSKFPIQSEFVPYQDLTGEDKFAQKGFIQCTATLPSNQKIGLLTTHIQAGYEGQPNLKERLSNLTQLTQAIQKYRSQFPDHPVFVLGDLNIDDQSDEYRQLIKLMDSQKLCDAGSLQGCPTVGKGNSLQKVFDSQEYTARIDYIFVPPNSIEWCLTGPKFLSTEVLETSFQHTYLYNEDEDLSDHYPVLAKVQLSSESLKKLELKLIRAKNLPKADLLSDSDPYAVIQMKDQTFKSQTIQDDLSPIWNETFTLKEPFGQVHFKIWDEDFGKDDFLGEADLDLQRFRFQKNQPQKVALFLKNQKGDAGTLYLELIPNFDQIPSEAYLPLGPARTLTSKQLSHLQSSPEILLSEDIQGSYQTSGSWHNTNWIPSIQQEPLAIYDVTCLKDCVKAVKTATRKKLRIRAVGSGHSYSEVLHAPDLLLTTHSMNKVLRKPFQYKNKKDQTKEWQVEVEGGMRLHYLIKKVLKPNKLAVANLGGYDGQTIAGVVSTGTHGSGRKIGPIASIIRSVVLVTRKGRVQRIEPKNGPSDPRVPETLEGYPVELIQDDDYFNSVTISWGCFGIIYAVILGLLPEYWLHETREVRWWSQLKTELNDLTLKHRHVEVLVSPYPQKKGSHKGDHICLLTRRDIVDKPSSIYTQGGRNFWTQLGGQFPVAFKSLIRLLNDQPQVTPWAVEQSIRGLVHHGYTQRYDKVLLLGMDATAEVGCATELAYPIKDNKYMEALEEMFTQAKIAAKYNQYLASPLSLRFVQKSSQPFSMSYGQDMCFIEMVTLAGVRGYREIMFRSTQAAYKHGGRPHWGLNFDQLNLSMSVKELYPKFDVWKKYYDQANRDGTFSNALTARLGFDPIQ